MTMLASSSDDTTVRIWGLDQISGLQNLDVKEVNSFLGRGTAEARPSWSMPSNQSEEDALVCLETMMESETSWSSAAISGRSSSFVSRRESSTSPQQPPEAHHLSRFISPSSNSPTSTSPPCSSPPLKQTTLDDLWKLRGAVFHRPVPRTGRVDCNPSPKQTPGEKRPLFVQSTEGKGIDIGGLCTSSRPLVDDQANPRSENESQISFIRHEVSTGRKRSRTAT